MEPTHNVVVDVAGLPSSSSTSSSSSHRPIDVTVRPAHQSGSSQEPGHYDAADETEHDHGARRTQPTTAIPAPSAARVKPPTPWKALKACKGFDLRTWVAASGYEPIITTTSPCSSSVSMPSSALSPSAPPADINADTTTALHRFPDLPHELRSKVWLMCLSWPRIVVVRGSMDCSTPGNETSGNAFGNVACNAHWYCENRSPVLFRVCAESRREALAFFRIHLPMRSPDPDSHGRPSLNQRNPAWHRIYINPDWDLVLFQGATRSLAILASDLLAYDPKGEGVAHYGAQGIWQVDPDPGFGMATLSESLAFLKSFVLCTADTSDTVCPLGEGYIHAVAGEVGQEGMQMIDWASHSRMLMRTPNNSEVRSTLVKNKDVEQRVVDDLVTVEMSARVRNSAVQNALNSSATGRVLQLAWQPPDRKISHVMHLTTAPLTV
ncbi:pectinesterase precursor [Colletotrichum camelliae]|nr:pectinesterase precursor [Colletotrichum camelliae]